MEISFLFGCKFQVHNLTRTSGNMSYAAADRGSHQFKVASKQAQHYWHATLFQEACNHNRHNAPQISFAAQLAVF